MNESVSELWVGRTALLLLVSLAISWLIFASFSMRPIEKKMRDASKGDSSQLDGPGWRVVWYAWAIFLPVCWCNNTRDPVLNPVNVKKFATRKDWWLAAWFFLSGYLFITLIVIDEVFWS